MKKIIIFLIITASSVFAQDTTRSQAFKQNTFYKPPIFKAKYPSYSLLAAYILVTESNRGDPFAQHELGLRYLLGQGFTADTVKAIYWIRKAVDQNLPSARYNYGILLYNGIGVPWNPFEAYLNFKSASKLGLPEAQFAYGLSLTDNLIVNRNMMEAYKLINQSAKAGFEPAKDILKEFKKMNFIAPVDTSSDYSNNSSADASVNLIQSNWDLDYYNFENDEKEKNIDSQLEDVLNKNSSELKKLFGLSKQNLSTKLQDTSGVGILKYAAQNGSPEALLIMARAYENGTIFNKELITAASNYLRAYRLGSYKAGEYLYKLFLDESFNQLLKEQINKGNAEAMYVWAGFSALGINNQISNKQVLDFLKSAVDKNHIPSMIELGLLYSSGSVVEKEKEKAIEYWNLAKSLGSQEAQIRIAFIELTESNDNRTHSKNIDILEKAVDSGSVFAQALLGYCLEKGIGTREDKAAAVKLYRQAAQRGNQSAFNSLKSMYDEIRPNDEEFQIFSEN